MGSKHSNAGPLISRGLYDGLTSFAELEQRIRGLGDEGTKVVGDAFEIFVEGYLATQPKMQTQDAWLVGQIPLEIRRDMNLPGDAKGIDGIFRTRTGVLVPYQVKFRSNRKYLTYTEVAPFLGLTERATDRIIFTNADEVALDAKNRDAMRTVRGIDFDDLTPDDLKAVSAWLRNRPAARPRLPPRPYQADAVEQISKTLQTHDRAQVAMACGTGKTLVALWATEVQQPKTVLVLVPSLTLLQQTVDEWSRHNIWGEGYRFICVCSDPTVQGKDSIVLDATDLELRVDTSPDEVRRFLTHEAAGTKVVFSTYQSARVVAEGGRGLAPLDIAVLDEAHKTTGRQGGLFAYSLRDDNLPIRKRLFLTATPRHYDIRHRDREGDFKLASMDDPAIYGPRAYTLTFGEAAKLGIICNYKVVISVVDGQEINDFALKHGITLVEGDLIGAKWVANQIAVERAIEKTGAAKIITFHSRVASAKEFSDDGTHGIKQFLGDFSVSHVNGNQKSSERKQLIADFRNTPLGLITNARCLTEGIDVPAVDMVAFIDPRHSKIDIAQATGRAMRKPEGSGKTTGYVVIPLFLDRRADEPLEAALKRCDFSDVANVLNAMREQDEDLIDIIRELKEANGRGEVFNPRRLAEKIQIIGPAIPLTTLRANIFAEIVDTIGVSWDEWYGRLIVYNEREGHCRVPFSFVENGYNLGHWVNHQRQSKGKLTTERIQRLEGLGFVWATDWEHGFSYLERYRDREGHCRVPHAFVENGYSLGRWVSYQREHKGTLTIERIQRLEELGFVWDPLATDWEQGFGCLKRYREREGHCRVSTRYKENGYNLGSWVNHQRRNKGTLTTDRIQSLEELGFVWDPFSVDWEQGIRYLKIYREREGHCRVFLRHKENGYSLGHWVSHQRQNKEMLTTERTQRLEELGFVWDAYSVDWEQGFAHLKTYKERKGHCRVPRHYKENGFSLGNWVNNQRKSKGTLIPDRNQRLDELGFEWDPLATDWEQGIGYLKIYREREGHCRIPRHHKEIGFSLGNWVHTRRKAKDTLPADRRRQLDELGFIWDAFATDWEQGFAYLRAYREREGHCRVPYHHKENGYSLGIWIVRQRERQRKMMMSAERMQKLDELGFVWNAR